MRDIILGAPGQDLGVKETDVPRAVNILAVQFGSLEYAPNFGRDLDFFLQPEFDWQNESFKRYLLEVLSRHGINVSGIDEQIDDLLTQYIIKIAPPNSDDGLVR